jgi:hypothetical protein
LILWDKKELILEKEIQFVKLIPINSNSDIDYLQLGIDISNNDIVKLIEIGKNKTKTILTVNQLQYDIEIDLNFFVFSEEDYPDYYIENL